MAKTKTKIVSRKKSRFKSARSAWLDIKRRGISESRIIGAGRHTSTEWRWRIKPKR